MDGLSLFTIFGASTEMTQKLRVRILGNKYQLEVSSFTCLAVDASHMLGHLLRL